MMGWIRSSDRERSLSIRLDFPRFLALDRAMRLLLFVVAFWGSLSSCARTSGYRQSEALTVESLKNGVLLGHVEMDDQGDLISDRQLRQVIDRIKSESREPMLLLIYIHGWNHNASGHWVSGDRDLQGFREALEKLGQATGQKTMGVFFSWRGRTLASFPVGVDYFHRHAAALRVGGEAGVAALYELGMTAREANRGNRVVMVGHSLGGAILESALGESMAAKVATASARGEPLKRRDFPADLAISLNSAGSAIHARQLITTFAERGIREVEGGPVLVSLTSRRDLVTGVFWPIGHFLGRYVPGFNWFNTGVAGQYRRESRKDRLAGTQREAHRTTVGHFEALFSHQYRKTGSEKRDLASILRDNRAVRAGNGFLVKGEEDVFLFSRRDLPCYNQTPYWIIPVPGEFIRSHWDQWNGNFIAIMTSLISLLDE